jgi:hypothetical protein
MVHKSRVPGGMAQGWYWIHPGPKSRDSKGSPRQLSRRRYGKLQGNCFEEARTTLGVLSVVLKWVGIALLVLACLLAVYLGAGLLAELAVRATYP